MRHPLLSRLLNSRPLSLRKRLFRRRTTGTFCMVMTGLVAVSWGDLLAPVLSITIRLGDLLASVQAWLMNTLAWIEGLGAIAPLLFILLYILVTIAFLPASVVTLGAGVVFGVIKGTALVFVGAMLGATAAFLVGRYLAREWVSRKIASNPKFQAIDDAITREGRKIIFFIRLSPVFPFNLLNYGLGLTNISLKDYVLGTTGIFPGTLLYVYLGSLAGNLATLGMDDAPSNPVVAWSIRLLALLATGLVTIYVTRIAQQALQQAVPSVPEDTPTAPRPAEESHDRLQ